MKKTAWIARTAICLALLLCLQFATKSLGQFVTGSCVNLVIAMAALIGGLISNYFFQPSVDARLRESYRRVLRHLRENTLSASDLSRIQNALTFLSPLCRDTREAHKDMMGVTLKTDALLRASR